MDNNNLIPGWQRFVDLLGSTYEDLNSGGFSQQLAVLSNMYSNSHDVKTALMDIINRAFWDIAKEYEPNRRVKILDFSKEEPYKTVFIDTSGLLSRYGDIFTIQEALMVLLSYLDPRIIITSTEGGRVEAKILSNHSRHWASLILAGDQSPMLEVAIDPGTAPTEVIADILADISILYRKGGGSGINFSFDGVEIHETVGCYE